MGAGSLSLTRPLLQWMQADPAWATLPLRQRAWLQWQARLGSLNARLAASPQASDTAPAAVEAPVLVLGPWRSGTTVMHELLAAATGLTTPRTWQCMNATTFTTLPVGQRAKASAARPMDGLTVDAQSPQEDEFALLTLGVESAYRAFWMPHRLHQLHHTLDAAHWLADDAWLAPWERFMSGVLHTTPQARQPLLLKSPNHTWRLPAILRRFSNAKLVWMARDPAQVLQSNRAMWGTMFRLHGLTAGDAAALDRFLEHALARAADVLQMCVQQLPPSQLVMVTHEHLLADPAGTTREVLRRLALPCDTTALAGALRKVAGGRVERHPVISPTAGVGALHAAQQAAAHSHGCLPS